MDAKLLWLTSAPASPRESQVGELILEALPVAAEGLDMMGVEQAESRRLLDIIRQRRERQLNTARWQSARVKDLSVQACRE